MKPQKSETHLKVPYFLIAPLIVSYVLVFFVLSPFDLINKTNGQQGAFLLGIIVMYISYLISKWVYKI